MRFYDNSRLINLVITLLRTFDKVLTVPDTIKHRFLRGRNIDYRIDNRLLKFDKCLKIFFKKTEFHIIENGYDMALLLGRLK